MPSTSIDQVTSADPLEPLLPHLLLPAHHKCLQIRTELWCKGGLVRLVDFPSWSINLCQTYCCKYIIAVVCETMTHWDFDWKTKYVHTDCTHPPRPKWCVMMTIMARVWRFIYFWLQGVWLHFLDSEKCGGRNSGPKSKPLGLAHPAAPGIGKVHSSNRPCRRRYFDRSPGRKKIAWSILGLGLSLVLTSTWSGYIFGWKHVHLLLV